jgi:hypothetical protein
MIYGACCHAHLFEVGLKASPLDHKFKKTMIGQIVMIQTQKKIIILFLEVCWTFVIT